jgi:hypothetical protein
MLLLVVVVVLGLLLSAIGTAQVLNISHASVLFSLTVRSWQYNEHMRVSRVLASAGPTAAAGADMCFES